MFDGADPAAGADHPTGGPVLGIDPGVSRCGYGVVRRAEGGRYEAVAYGVITTPPGDPMPQRLLTVATELEALVAEYRPSALAVERVLFQTNARTAMSVGQANGLAQVAAARVGVPVVEYSPNEVKLAVTGHGAAGKAQVQEMVHRINQHLSGLDADLRLVYPLLRLGVYLPGAGGFAAQVQPLLERRGLTGQ